MAQDHSRASETDYARIKSNISKMIDQQAPEADIDAYLASEGVTADQLRAPAQPQQNMAQQPWQPIQGTATSVAGSGQLGNDGAVSYRLPNDEMNAGSVLFRDAKGTETAVPIYDLDPQSSKFFADQYKRLYGQDPPLMVSVTNTVQPPVNQEYSTIPSEAQGFVEGAANVFNHAAGRLESGLDAVGVAKPLNEFGAALGMAPSVSAVQSDQDRLFANSPYKSGAVGRFAGETAALLPLAAVPGGAFVQGVGAGALMSDSTTPLGVAGDALTGGAASAVGSAALRGVGQLANPRLPQNLQTLFEEGVRVTPGQMARATGTSAGRAVGLVEDTIGNLPGVGAPIQAAQRAGVEDFARAPVNRALRQIRERLPRNVESGFNSIDYAQQRFSAAYQDVLPKLSGRLDNAFSSRINAIQARANVPADTEAARNIASATQELGYAFTGAGPNGAFNGRTLRDASERLGDLASAWRRSDDPYVRISGDVADQYRRQLHALARRQNPVHAARLREIDRGYASLVRAERAALAGDGGVPTPRQYQAAIRQTDQSARRRQFAAGNSLDQDLSNAGVSVLANRASQGGSTSTNGLLALLGTLGAAATGNPAAQAGGLAGLATLGTTAVTHNPAILRGIQAALGRQGYRSPQAAQILELLARGAPAVLGPQAPRMVGQLGQ